MIDWQVTVWGREITITAWFCLHAIIDIGFYRCRYLPPSPGFGYPGERINMAHANVYTPVFGVGVEVWKH